MHEENNAASPNSLGAALINAVTGEYLDDINDQFADEIFNHYIDTVDLDQPAWIWSADLPTASYIQYITPVSDTSFKLAQAGSYKEFIEQDLGQNGYWHNTKNDSLYFMTNYGSVRVFADTTFDVDLEPFHVWNTLDDMGMTVDLKRLHLEDNASFQMRIKDVYVNKPGVSKDAFYNALRREFGILEGSTPVVTAYPASPNQADATPKITEISELKQDSVYFNAEGLAQRPMYSFVRKLMEEEGFGWDHFRWGENVWDHGGEEHKGLDTIPKQYDSNETTEYLPGVGDLNDLRVLPPQDHEAKQSFDLAFTAKGKTTGDTFAVNPPIELEAETSIRYTDDEVLYPDVTAYLVFVMSTASSNYYTNVELTGNAGEGTYVFSPFNSGGIANPGLEWFDYPEGTVYDLEENPVHIDEVVSFDFRTYHLIPTGGILYQNIGDAGDYQAYFLTDPTDYRDSATPSALNVTMGDFSTPVVPTIGVDFKKSAITADQDLDGLNKASHSVVINNAASRTEDSDELIDVPLKYLAGDGEVDFPRDLIIKLNDNYNIQQAVIDYPYAAGFSIALKWGDWHTAEGVFNTAIEQDIISQLQYLKPGQNVELRLLPGFYGPTWLPTMDARFSNFDSATEGDLLPCLRAWHPDVKPAYEAALIRLSTVFSPYADVVTSIASSRFGFYDPGWNYNLYSSYVKDHTPDAGSYIINNQGETPWYQSSVRYGPGASSGAGGTAYFALYSAVSSGTATGTLQLCDPGTTSSSRTTTFDLGQWVEDIYGSAVKTQLDGLGANSTLAFVDSGAYDEVVDAAYRKRAYVVVGDASSSFGHAAVLSDLEMIGIRAVSTDGSGDPVDLEFDQRALNGMSSAQNLTEVDGGTPTLIGLPVYSEDIGAHSGDTIADGGYLDGITAGEVYSHFAWNHRQIERYIDIDAGILAIAGQSIEGVGNDLAGYLDGELILDINSAIEYLDPRFKCSVWMDRMFSHDPFYGFWFKNSANTNGVSIDATDLASITVPGRVIFRNEDLPTNGWVQTYSEPMITDLFNAAGIFYTQGINILGSNFRYEGKMVQLEELLSESSVTENPLFVGVTISDVMFTEAIETGLWNTGSYKGGYLASAAVPATHAEHLQTRMYSNTGTNYVLVSLTTYDGTNYGGWVRKNNGETEFVDDSNLYVSTVSDPNTVYSFTAGKALIPLGPNASQLLFTADTLIVEDTAYLDNLSVSSTLLSGTMDEFGISLDDGDIQTNIEYVNRNKVYKITYQLSRSNFMISEDNTEVVNWINVSSSNPQVITWLETNTVRPFSDDGELNYGNKYIQETEDYKYTVTIFLTPKISNDKWFPEIHSGYGVYNNDLMYHFATPVYETSSPSTAFELELSNRITHGAPVIAMTGDSTPTLLRQTHFTDDSGNLVNYNTEIVTGNNTTNLYLGYSDIYDISIKNLATGEVILTDGQSSSNVIDVGVVTDYDTLYEATYRVADSFYVDYANVNELGPVLPKVYFDATPEVVSPKASYYKVFYEHSEEAIPTKTVPVPLNPNYTAQTEGFIYYSSKDYGVGSIETFVTPDAIIADGKDYSLVVVRVYDTLDNPAFYRDVRITTDFGTLRFYEDSNLLQKILAADFVDVGAPDGVDPTTGTSYYEGQTIDVKTDAEGAAYLLLISEASHTSLSGELTTTVESISETTTFRVQPQVSGQYEIMALPNTNMISVAEEKDFLFVSGLVQNEGATPMSGEPVFWKKNRHVHNLNNVYYEHTFSTPSAVTGHSGMTYTDSSGRFSIGPFFGATPDSGYWFLSVETGWQKIVDPAFDRDLDFVTDDSSDAYAITKVEDSQTKVIKVDASSTDTGVILNLSNLRDFDVPYIASVWVKNISGRGSLSVRNLSGPSTVGTVNSSTNIGEWERIHFEFTPTAGNTYAIRLGSGGAGTTGEYYFAYPTVFRKDRKDIAGDIVYWYEAPGAEDIVTYANLPNVSLTLAEHATPIYSEYHSYSGTYHSATPITANSTRFLPPHYLPEWYLIDQFSQYQLQIVNTYEDMLIFKHNNDLEY